MDTNNEVTASIAAQLRGIIATKDLLKKDVALSAGLSLATLSRYLNGHRDIPVPAFLAICAALGTDAGAILDEAGKQL